MRCRAFFFGLAAVWLESIGAGSRDSCEVGIPPDVLYIVNRDYVVDEVAGVVNVFCRFGNSATGMPDSHTVRLVDGKITNVHTISVNLNPDAPSPRADDNGAIVRTGHSLAVFLTPRRRAVRPLACGRASAAALGRCARGEGRTLS